jgi:hypothetical protein
MFGTGKWRFFLESGVWVVCFLESGVWVVCFLESGVWIVESGNYHFPLSTLHSPLSTINPLPFN